MMGVASVGEQSGAPLSIVFIHGFLDNQAVWSPLIQQLGSVERAHYTLDLRGAGALRTERGPYTLAQSVADVLRLIDQQQMARVVLVGHSMGGQIAELVAMKLPERVVALVLLTPVSLAGTDLPPEVATFLRTSGDDAAAQREIRRQFSRNLSVQEIERLVCEDVSMGVAAVEGYFDAFSGGDSLGNGPCAYAGPMLLVGAQEDPVVPIDAIDAMAHARFPAARLVRIAQSGHWPHLEQPGDTATALGDFLLEVDR
ncbi:pimeloyl-ACP methyl ester carboxylesterase [Paraburkholderia sp. RAU2J]|uniref:alpha/beta fold hydrolase n=1 Tax=Paraburkholderia sp. RAU2J TaxID=1938810 RepID=UPI000EB4C69E|nr:alpha/beta hydrolase [Paraburkholderia sp. RAU2J]RKT13528.1 pimeloyl-ACP methyl ester carboxylesterase [Paraburkholderia sp. RAU2J]